MTFKDHFSRQADDYARYRPRYPEEMFAWLAGHAPGRGLAWDSATGNGQAAEGLAGHFRAVFASDASRDQIARAAVAPGIAYAVCRSEAVPLPPASVDVVFVGQALHWLDLPTFYREVRRVSRPRGLLAVCGYGPLRVSPPVDARVGRFYRETVGPYWPPERAIVERGYRDLPFPFERLAPPPFRMRRRWRLDELLGYIGSWSAVVRYRADQGDDPLPALAAEVAAVWGEPATPREIEWPLHLIVGRVDNGDPDAREE